MLSASVLCAVALAVPAQAATSQHRTAAHHAHHDHHARSARAAGHAGPLSLKPPVVSATGFDTCAAPSAQAIASWRASSSYRAIGVYIGGSNRACGAGNLSKSWVHTVSGQGWRLVPIYVGLQAPCAQERKGASVMSAAKAAEQGTAAANDAVSGAKHFDIAAGSPIYYDLEAFTETDQSCVRTVTAFLNAWTRQLHAHGYYAGVYASADAGMSTLAGVVRSNRSFAPPDAIWIARWDKKAKTADASVPDSMWVHHQRIKQYQGGHTETHGGVSLNIDSDYLDGPVARIAG
ncbi:DUF1906 domain-containing protein [Actinospica robiniae]|uniref:DUF1906 domain-containing protein n=1 Tax=Actinospica robiniae TaxID=304901 RepID=UPI0003FFCD79|nr:DUF1906 domain-containing protein [Actinospica robiniae]